MKKQSESLGSCNFRVEFNKSRDLRHDHVLVGTPIKVSPIAMGSLEPLRGKKGEIVGVIEKFGQTLGYQVKIGETTLIGGKRDILVRRKYLQDFTPLSMKGLSLQTVISEWSQAKEYQPGQWEGLEAFFFEIAKVADALGFIQDVNTERSQIWRLYVPDGETYIQINLSLFFQNQSWFLSYHLSPAETDMEGVTFVEKKSHWGRVNAWMYYMVGSKKYLLRDKINKQIMGYAAKLLQTIGEAYQKTFQRKPFYHILDVGISKINSSPKGIGSHLPPSDVTSYSILTVDPKALLHLGYFQKVLLHEMTHYILGDRSISEEHGEDFQELGKALGIPKNLRD